MNGVHCQTSIATIVGRASDGPKKSIVIPSRPRISGIAPSCWLSRNRNIRPTDRRTNIGVSSSARVMFRARSWRCSASASASPITSSSATAKKTKTIVLRIAAP